MFNILPGGGLGGSPSRLLAYGLGGPAVSEAVGKGHGPLPVRVGTADISEVLGKGYSPLPIRVGVPLGLIGRGNSPLPILIGVGVEPSEYPIDVGVPRQVITGSPGITISPDYKPSKGLRKKILRDDEELLELAAHIVASGILE